MDIVVGIDGQVRCLYTEAIDLTAFGSPSIRRASYVVPDEGGKWRANLAPVGGPCLGPFDRRSEALAAEVAWLENYWLT